MNRPKHRQILSLQFLVSCVLCATLGLSPIHPSQAREPDSALRDTAALLQTSMQLRIGVVGDSIAGDLANGMQKLLGDRDNLKVIKFTKPATGLMRDDVYNWQLALKNFVRKTKLDVIAVMIGGNDRQSIWINGSRLTPGSEAWRAEYEHRVARFMTILATADAKIYWVGLPPVRSEQLSRDYRMLNEIFHAQARKHGFSYVSTWDTFVDGKGGYSSFGRSMDGTRRRLRKDDGMHFTIYGELRLAETVASAIGRDLEEIKTVH